MFGGHKHRRRIDRSRRVKSRGVDNEGRELGDCSRPSIFLGVHGRGKLGGSGLGGRSLLARRIALDERKRREDAVMEASRTRKTGTSRKSSPNGSKSDKSSAKSSKGKSKPRPALESFNPATGELIGTVETITPAKVQGIVDDVAEVQPFWAALTLEDRARYMRRAVDVLLADLDEIADLLTNEQGKPRVESYTMELLPTLDSLKW